VVARRRSIVYIDGFNLYYGVIRGSAHKWLNIQRFFERLRADDDLCQVYYFTALVEGPSRVDQIVYLRAFETLPLVTIVLGRFKTRRRRCLVAACDHAGNRFFGEPEEKRSDVNIALQMLEDAYEDQCDNLVLVSGDSDLVPAIGKVKSRFPGKRVIVYVPATDPVRAAAVELRSAADRARALPLDLLKHCQLPQEINVDGGTICKPATW